MQVSFDFAALNYLNLWLRTDREVCRLINAGSDEEQRRGVIKGAVDYGVARNAPKKYDEGQGIQRFQRILDVLKTASFDQFERDRLLAIGEIEREISRAYGGRKVLSLTTKLLWFKLKSPIIMYDRQARVALGTENGDLAGFYAAWEAKFGRHRQEIAAACGSLVGVRTYAIDQETATAEHIADIAAQQWFQGRVFDSYLWHGGLSV